MQKIKIDVRADIPIYTNIQETARFIADNQRDIITDLADSNGDNKVDFSNIKLFEFDVLTKMSIADNI